MKYAGIGWPSAFRKKPVSIGWEMIAFTTITSPRATRSGTRMRASPIGAPSAAPVQRDLHPGVGGPDLAACWSAAIARTQVVRFILIRVEMDTEPIAGVSWKAARCASGL